MTSAAHSIASADRSAVTVDVAWLDVSTLTEEALQWSRSVVDAAVLAQVDRMLRPADRTARVAAHALVRQLLSAVSGVPAVEFTLRRSCPRCGGSDHGKPEFALPDGRPGPHASLSHSGRWVCAAVAHVPVGIDIEDVDRPIDWSAIESLVRHPDEPSAGPAESVRRWVRKEAALKALGVGLATPMTSQRVESAQGTPHRWRATTPDHPPVTGCDLDLATPAAVAVGEGVGDWQVRLHPARPEPGSTRQG